MGSCIGILTDHLGVQRQLWTDNLKSKSRVSYKGKKLIINPHSEEYNLFWECTLRFFAYEKSQIFVWHCFECESIEKKLEWDKNLGKN